MISQTIITGDCLDVLPTLDAGSVQCVVSSPPYWGLRDYGIHDAGGIGLEKTFDEWLAVLVRVFGEVRRVLRDDGVVFLNIGDAYATHTKGQGGHNPQQDRNRGSRWHTTQTYDMPSNIRTKECLGMPWRLAFALQADGWYLRSDIIWHKPNPMPESVTDRPTKAHEYVFLLTKHARYYWDAEAVREAYVRLWEAGRPNGTINARTRDASLIAPNPTGRNIRSVWTIPTEAYRGAHFATFPRKLVIPCVKAGTSEKGCCPQCGK